MTGRVDRGFQGGGEAPFSIDQRVFLLERDMDENDGHIADVRAEVVALRKLITTRLNVLVGIGFSLLIAVVSVLVTVIASQR